MPHIVTREQAIEKINSAIKPGECLICSILRSEPKFVLHKGSFTSVFLSLYPRTWGQTMIVLNTHKTAVSETTAEEWDELSKNARKASIVIETTLSPLRCYLASLGSTDNLPNTCPHLHFNVLPIYNKSDKPENIFSWKGGVYDADETEWIELLRKLKKQWETITETGEQITDSLLK